VIADATSTERKGVSLSTTLVPVDSEFPASWTSVGTGARSILLLVDGNECFPSLMSLSIADEDVRIRMVLIHLAPVSLPDLSDVALDTALVAAKALVRVRQQSLLEAVDWMEDVFAERDQRAQSGTAAQPRSAMSFTPTVDTR
jgi:hypothetical protein